MIRAIIISLAIAIAGNSASLAQIPEPFSQWEDEVLQKAYTATEANYLSEDEKKVIYYANLARADGPLFAETFLKEYMSLKDMKSSKYTKSLFAELKKVRNLPMMFPENDLYRAARDHAAWSGKKGYEGHKGFKSRYEPLLNKYLEVGENIYYGRYTPLEIVIQLLIDEGVQDLGHRQNLLNPRFNVIGVAIKPHKSYDYNCVMGFGLLPRSYEDYIQ